MEQIQDPYSNAYSKPELDDPIGEFLKQAYPDPPAEGPSGAPYSKPLTKEGILNNFYGYNPLSVSDGIKIALAKMGMGGKSPEEKSSGGYVPRNIPQAFLGKVFKSIGKAISGVVKGVTNAVKSVGKTLGSFLNSPIGQIVSFGLSFTPLAPIVAGVKAVVALTQGDILGAIVGGMGALGAAFPGTFGEGGTFFAGLNKTFGEGLGGVMGGFLTGGFGGAIGALPDSAPEGLQNIFKGIGGFLEENQVLLTLFKCSWLGPSNWFCSNAWIVATCRYGWIGYINYSCSRRWCCFCFTSSSWYGNGNQNIPRWHCRYRC